MTTTRLTLSQVPLTLWVAPFVIGVILNDFISAAIIYPILMTISLLGFLIFRSKDSLHWTYRSAIILIAILLCGFVHASYQDLRKNEKLLHPNLIKKEHVYNVEILDVSKTEKYTNLIVSLRYVNMGHVAHDLSSNKCMIKIKDPNYANNIFPGHFYNIQSKLRLVLPQSNLGGFNYDLFLQRQGISYLGYSTGDQIYQDLNSSFAKWKIVRYDIRTRLIQTIDDFIDESNAAAIVKALILGHKDDLSDEQLATFIDSGTMHVLAVSGLHVGIVAYLLMGLCRVFFPWLGRWSIYQVIFVIVGLCVFSELSGGAPPVARAVLMTSIYMISKTSGKYIHTLNLLALAAIVLILHDHNIIYRVSFQLSFVAVAGIILIYPILESLYNPENKITRYCTSIIYMGIAAQIVLFPLSFYYFNQISLLSPLTSIASISAAFVLIISGTIMIISTIVHDNVFTDMIAQLIQGIVHVLERVTHLMSEVNLFIIDNVYFEGIESLVLLTAIFCMAIAFHSRSKILIKYGLILIFIQSTYHCAVIINHMNCIDIVYDDQGHNIEEVYIGRTAYINHLKKSHSNDINAKRKHHRIKYFKTLNESIYGKLSNDRLDYE